MKFLILLPIFLISSTNSVSSAEEQQRGIHFGRRFLMYIDQLAKTRNHYQLETLTENQADFRDCDKKYMTGENFLRTYVIGKKFNVTFGNNYTEQAGANTFYFEATCEGPNPYILRMNVYMFENLFSKITTIVHGSCKKLR